MNIKRVFCVLILMTSLRAQSEDQTIVLNISDAGLKRPASYIRLILKEDRLSLSALDQNKHKISNQNFDENIKQIEGFDYIGPDMVGIRVSIYNPMPCRMDEQYLIFGVEDSSMRLIGRLRLYSGCQAVRKIDGHPEIVDSIDNNAKYVYLRERYSDFIAVQDLDGTIKRLQYNKKQKLFFNKQTKSGFYIELNNQIWHYQNKTWIESTKAN